MPMLSPRYATAVTVIAACLLVGVHAHSHATKESYVAASSIATMSMAELEDKLQECPIVQDLNAYRHATHPPHSTLTSRAFALLFPSSNPGINALLATLYISGPPNFLLALCPPNIDPASLSIMVAFAVGGLLGDTLFHLLPEIFLGEGGDGVRFVMVEPNRNLLLGVAILVGFVTFVAMDKGLRIATGGAGHSHSHDHSAHSHEEVHDTKALDQATASTTAIEMAGHASQRKKDANVIVEANKVITKEVENLKPINNSVKMAGYLNLIADFTHNITDGLAMASSFYASPTIGATTTVAVFFHEIPHEVGDFALLIQSGFSKRQAMMAQFGTAVGALLGTLIGIAVQECGGKGVDAQGMNAGIMGTSLTWGDMLLPFTAGTFLFVGTVAVIPELLETGSNKREETGKALKMFGAMATGAGIMLYISWH